MPERILNESKASEQGRIVKIRGTGDFHRGLIHMGMSIGHIVKVERKTSPEDSLEVEVCGRKLSLNGEETTKIYVQPT